MADTNYEDIPLPPSPDVLFQINENPTIPILPPVTDKRKFDVVYPLLEPYAYAHIFWDEEHSELVYQLEEPLLDEAEQNVLGVIERGIEELINISFINVKRTDVVIAYLEKNIKVLLGELGIKVSEETFLKLMYYVYRDFVGLNNIEPLMKDFFIEDIECNGVNTPIYIVHRKYRNIRTNIVYDNPEDLTSFVEKLAQKCGKYVSYANPLLDGRLPDGSRINATFTEEISSRGPTFCFKDGHVQLHDGNVKNVKELFEEAKEKFGSKVEDGNEIVEVTNMGLCGVEEKNLTQKDAKITSLIKIKPPKQLVKLLFDDGGDVEVTPDHLFHVAGESLKTVRAKDLKEGMLIPMPKKINVSGYRQKINVYSLLKDFSYVQRICVTNIPKINEIIRNEIEINRGGGYRQILAQKYDVGPTYFYEIMSRGNSISFNVLDKICQAKNIDFSEFDNIAITVYGGGTKNKTKKVKVPKEIDENLAYLAGALISDGNLSKAHINVACYEEGFKKSVKERLLKIFGKCDSYYNDQRVYLCNIFVPYFFNKVFGIPIGKKSRIVKIPEIIYKSDNAVIRSFIKGLFDGDGSTKSGLSYKTYSKELAEGLTYLLGRFGIYTYLRNSGDEYTVNIPSPYYAKYKEIIGFDSFIKKQELKKLIEKQIDHKTFIRHDRIPAEIILNIIKKLNISKNELTKKMGISYNRFYYPTFSRSFARSILQEIKKNRNKIAVEKEIKYFEWLINTNQEFVKLSKVDVIPNEDPVYDLTLEPCKFFIAGNRPMNMFDTIRKFTAEPWSPVKMIDLKTVSPEVLAYLWMLVEYESNFMIIGATGAGKTSFLNMLAFFIPPASRIVSIEDTHEINIVHENWLPSVVRESIGFGGEGQKEIDLFTLLRESFRQRPDYVIVGEVRGKEAFVLFQGAASGHATMSTMHAEDVNTMVRRLETAPISLPPALVENLDVVCVMSQAKVKGDNVRRLRAVTEIVSVGERTGSVKTNTPFVWDPKTDSFFYKTESKVFDKLVTKYGLSRQFLDKEFKRRTKLFLEMYKREIFDFQEVQDIINQYYKLPEEIMKRFNIL